MPNQIQNQNFKNLIGKYGIKPNKRMGQNFLLDESVLEKIIVAADISPKEMILEIGPGLGVLTFELAKRAKQVIAIEKDKKLAEILNHELKIKNIKNVEIVNDDILKIPIRQLADQISNQAPRLPAGRQNPNYKIVANIPYYLTSPIIRKFLETENKPEAMILMVQKEVAQRICAKPGQMSILSVAVQFYGWPEIVDYVSKKSFYPQPKVDSAIIKIVPKEIPEIDTKKFFKLIRTGFSAKRKFLINNLSSKIQRPPASPSEAGWAKSKFQNIFAEIGLDEKIRAENLTISDWLKLYAVLKNYF